MYVVPPPQRSDPGSGSGDLRILEEQELQTLSVSVLGEGGVPLNFELDRGICGAAEFGKLEVFLKNNEEAKVSREEAFEEGLCHMVQKLVNILKQIDPKDPFRIDMTDKLLEKLRGLSTVLVRLKFAEHLKKDVTYIEQVPIRVGPESVTDPAFLVTRNMEDFVTWVDSSKIKRKVLQYNDKLDD
ncbi:unnamed protein product [Sphenostylis stenocarpa]|uniref:U3 small nucleolar ribonucleoprotein protein IMP3 n=1 Tax=Sphenostylis stenocarpa TaxID=92480 RepID=A0AA86VV56_9FABA|nr:unnamed protein product [Sphenostylis stenocarpa]